MVKAIEAGKGSLSVDQATRLTHYPLMTPATATDNYELPIRVLIIDGHEAVRRALRIRLSVPQHLDVVGVSTDPVSAAEQIEARRPHVIILGLHSTSDEGMAKVVKAVHDMSGETVVVIVLAPYADAVERELLMNAGAKRYLLKHINSDQLIKEIESAVSDEAGMQFPPDATPQPPAEADA